MSKSLGGTTPTSAALEQFLRNSYTVVQAVHDNLDSIQAVADHLTPVEDLVEFRNEVTALYAKLGVLVAASELLVQASDAGLELLQAMDAAAQRTLLGLKSAALQEAGYFASSADFLALSSDVAALSDILTQVLTDLAAKVDRNEFQTAVVDLQSQIDALGDGNDTSIGEVNTRITQLISELEAGYGFASAQALDSLVTRVAQTETGMLAEAARTTALEASLESLDGQVAGTATALNGLTVRVETSEQGIDALASDVTQLNTQVGNLATGQAAQSNALQSLETRTTQTEGSISAHSGALTQLDAEVTDLDHQVQLAGTAISGLETRMTSSELGQTVLANQFDQLDVRLQDTETGLISQSEAMESLTTRIEATEGSLVVAAEERTSLRSSLSSTGNYLPNSGFAAGLRGWTLFSRGAGWLTAQLERNLAPTAPGALPEGMVALSLTADGVPSGNAGIRCANVPVEDLAEYLLSGYLAAENCTLRLEWRLLDGTGQEIGFGLAGQVTDTPPSARLSEWTRVHGPIPVAQDGAQVQVQLWVTNCHDGSPRIWLLRPQLEPKLGEQEGPSPWMEGVTGIEETLSTATQVLETRVEQTEDELSTLAQASTNLSSRVGSVREWRIVQHSGSGSFDAVGSPLAPGLYPAGSLEPAHSFQRGLTLVRFNLDGSLASATRFDTYASATERNNLRNALTALDPGDSFLLVSQDNHGIKQADLTAAIEAAGGFAFATVLGSRPYILVGQGAAGKGGGTEFLPAGTLAWQDRYITVVNDTPKGSGDRTGLVEAMAGQADALQTLETQVTSNTEGLIAAGTSITNLGARLDTAENLIATKADSSAVQTLDSRVTANEDAISSQATSVTDLQAAVALLPTVYLQPEEPTGGGFIVGDMWLDSNNGNKVRVWDGTLWGEAVDLVGATIYAQPEPPGPGQLRVGDVWFDTDNGNRQHRWDGTQWSDVSDDRVGATVSAVSELTTRVEATENTLIAHGTQLTDLEATVGTTHANALNQLDVRVTENAGDIESVATRTTNLETTLNDPDTGLLATSTALDELTTEVSSIDGEVVAQAGRLLAIESRMPAGGGTVATEASLTEEVNTLALADSALASRTSNLEARMPAGSGQLATSASVTDEADARTSADTALGNRISTIEARVPTGTDMLANEARVVSAEQAAATATSAVASDLDAVEARMPSGTGKVATEASVTSLASATAAADTANANAITALGVKFDRSVYFINGDFEQDEGWIINRYNDGGTWVNGPAAYYASTGLPWSGTRVLRINGDATPGLNARGPNSIRREVTPGKRFRVRFMQHGGNNGGASGNGVAGFQIRFMDKTGATINYQGDSFATVNGWVAREFVAEAPANSALMEVWYFFQNVTQGIVSLDALSIEPLDPATVANGQAIDAINLAINQQDDFIQGVANDLETLDLQIQNPTTGLNARAKQTDFSTLKTRVDTVGGGIETMASNLTSVSATVGSDPSNLIKKGQFFSDLSRGAWNTGVVVEDTSPDNTTGYCLSNTTSMYEVWGYFPVQPGEQFDIEMDVFTDHITGGYIIAGIHTVTKDGVNGFSSAVWDHSGSAGLANSDGNGWFRVKGVITVPTGNTINKGRPFVFTQGGFTGTYYVNNMRLTRRTRTQSANAQAYQMLDAQVNHATTGLATKASSSALTAVEASLGALGSNQLVTNGSFETDEDWVFSPPTSLSFYSGADASVINSGSRSLRFNTLSSMQTCWNRHRVPVRKLHPVRARMSVRNYGAGAGVTVRCGVRCFRADGSYIMTVVLIDYVTPTASAYYVDLDGYGLLHEEAAFAEASVYVFNHTTGGSIFVDDVDIVLDGPENPTTAAVTQLLRADVDAVTGRMQATYGLVVQAGGDVTGMQLLAGGGTSAIRFLANSFQIVDPSGTAKTEYSAGAWTVHDSAGRLRMKWGVW